jgi:UDP-N-acetylmuramoylalanine--D-glutamate ligase
VIAWHDAPAAEVPWARLNVVVCGLGVTGRAVVDVVADLGATVTPYDDANGSAPPALHEVDLIVTSPGLRPSHPLLVGAASAGVPVWGDVELAWRLTQPPTRWLGITGTNGKTTTTEMLGAMIRTAGVPGGTAGNIGTPVVTAVVARPAPELLAVELSSAQLHWAPSVRCEAAAILNVADDHLDWHGGPEAYAAAKASIWKRGTLAVYNVDDAWSSRLAAAAPDDNRVGFTLGEPADGQVGVSDGVLVDRALGAGVLVRATDLQVSGPHNVANALAAAALALAAGLPAEAVRTALREFRTGAHRNVMVATIDGVTYVNDSKATNPHAAAASLSAYPHVVWIAGGLNKGLAFDDVAREHASRLRAAVLIGTCADELGDALARHAASVPVVRADSMETAVETARALAQPGDVVLLAPAAASMDMFDNYAARGDAFVAAVRGMEGS